MIGFFEYDAQSLRFISFGILAIKLNIPKALYFSEVGCSENLLQFINQIKRKIEDYCFVLKNSRKVDRVKGNDWKWQKENEDKLL